LAARTGTIFSTPPGPGTVVKPLTCRIASNTRYASSGVSGSGEISVTLPRTRSSNRKFLPVSSAIILITSVSGASWKSRLIVRACSLGARALLGGACATAIAPAGWPPGAGAGC
jgi:hypothetical protein